MTNKNSQQTTTGKTTLFDVEQYLPVYRHLPPEVLIKQFEKTLQHAIHSGEDAINALFGTMTLGDGREARVKVIIEAAQIEQPTQQ